MTEEAARRKAEEERVVAEGERVVNEGVRQTQEGAGEIEVSRVEAEVDRDHAEATRDSAEAARVRAHLSRREAEKGRVEAEEGRVDAEEKRRSVRLAYAIPLAFIALIPSLLGLYFVSEESDKRCRDAALNRQAIRDTVLVTFSSLGYRYDDETGEATKIGGELAYYKAHPAEQAVALKNALATVERFPPISC